MIKGAEKPLFLWAEKLDVIRLTIQQGQLASANRAIRRAESSKTACNFPWGMIIYTCPKGQEKVKSKTQKLGRNIY